MSVPECWPDNRPGLDREVPWSRACRAVLMATEQPRGLLRHVCGRSAGHPGSHHCAWCSTEWPDQ